ncbi:hemin uptake protein HemP [Paracidovorax sp. MALMAid1276]|uniref:hemin uptake protein HemP n=1 Tax=Paracidovorax sp. MALMAid1276 TaxID=3411631 RepID=UPI003B9C8BAB
MQATLTAASLLRSTSAELSAPRSERGTHRLDDKAVAAVDSSALLRGQKTVSISHNGSVYRLQATKLGKLILTK